MEKISKREEKQTRNCWISLSQFMATQVLLHVTWKHSKWTMIFNHLKQSKSHWIWNVRTQKECNGRTHTLLLEEEEELTMLMRRAKRRKAKVEVNAAGTLPIFVFQLSCDSSNRVLSLYGSHLVGLPWSTQPSVGILIFLFKITSLPLCVYIEYLIEKIISIEIH